MPIPLQTNEEKERAFRTALKLIKRNIQTGYTMTDRDLCNAVQIIEDLARSQGLLCTEPRTAKEAEAAGRKAYEEATRD
jgi:hypothetical protein